MGVYGACFILSAYMSYSLAKHNDYNKSIPYMVDSGNEYAEHVRAAHSVLQRDEWKEINAGSLTFDDDKRWAPLQAADVIS
jgi:hypothetical protein